MYTMILFEQHLNLECFSKKNYPEKYGNYYPSKLRVIVNLHGWESNVC